MIQFPILRLLQGLTIDESSGLPIGEQIADALAAKTARVIDLFREWDDDGNGALDKYEMRMAVAALGYDAPKHAVDALFNSIDDDGNGWIEFHELKTALVLPLLPSDF